MRVKFTWQKDEWLSSLLQWVFRLAQLWQLPLGQGCNCQNGESNLFKLAGIAAHRFLRRHRQKNWSLGQFGDRSWKQHGNLIFVAISELFPSFGGMQMFVLSTRKKALSYMGFLFVGGGGVGCHTGHTFRNCLCHWSSCYLDGNRTAQHFRDQQLWICRDKTMQTELWCYLCPFRVWSTSLW